jgi:hypothetical protein
VWELVVKILPKYSPMAPRVPIEEFVWDVKSSIPEHAILEFPFDSGGTAPPTPPAGTAGIIVSETVESG